MRSIQSGQALPLGLALLLVGSLGALVLFNTGQLATDKQRLANAADAAAYSGLVWQARALNFQAYTNRAMVANQVTIAQAVSLNSWLSYGGMVSNEIAAVTAPIPGFNVLTRGLDTGFDAVDSVVSPLTRSAVPVVDTINGVLATAQEAIFASSFVATPEIVSKVASASDRRFRTDTAYSVAGLVDNLSDWRDFTDSVSDADVERMAERGDVIMASRDGFSEERYWEFFDAFWIYTTPLSRHKIYREGDTRLVSMPDGDRQRWEWRAVDTAALQNRFWRPLRSERKVEVPIAWGGAIANDNNSARTLLRTHCRRRAAADDPDCRYWTSKNRKTERIAERSTQAIQGYNGLRAFRTLSEQALSADNHDPVLRLRTEVALEATEIRSSQVLTTGETFALDVQAPGEMLSSISVAEVFYRRPDYGHGNSNPARLLEAANGYNPYWDVRLAPIEAGERLAALVLRGDTGGASRAPASVTDASASSAQALPDYAGQVASGGAAADESVISGLIADRTRSAAMSIEAFEPMDNPLDFFRDELERELRSAATRIVTGLAQQGQAAVDELTTQISEVVPDAAELDEIAEAAQAFQRDMEQLRDNVAADFQPELDRLHAGYVGNVERIEGLISGAREELVTASGDADVPIQRRIRRYESDLSDARESLVSRLAVVLVESVDRHAPDHLDGVITTATAEAIVRSLLEDLENGVIDEAVDALPWGN